MGTLGAFLLPSHAKMKLCYVIVHGTLSSFLLSSFSTNPPYPIPTNSFESLYHTEKESWYMNNVAQAPEKTYFFNNNQIL